MSFARSCCDEGSSAACVPSTSPTEQTQMRNLSLNRRTKRQRRTTVHSNVPAPARGLSGLVNFVRGHFAIQNHVQESAGGGIPKEHDGGLWQIQNESGQTLAPRLHRSPNTCGCSPSACSGSWPATPKQAQGCPRSRLGLVKQPKRIDIVHMELVPIGANSVRAIVARNDTCFVLFSEIFDGVTK